MAIIKKSHLGGVFMKKAGIIAGMVIWSLVAVRYICEANEKKSDIFTAFATSNCNYVTGKVIGEGEYSIYGNIADKEYAVKKYNVCLRNYERLQYGIV